MPNEYKKKFCSWQGKLRVCLFWNYRPYQFFPKMKDETKRTANICRLFFFKATFFQHWKLGVFEHVHWIMFIWCTSLETKRIKAAIGGPFITKLLKQYKNSFLSFVLFQLLHSDSKLLPPGSPKEEYSGQRPLLISSPGCYELLPFSGSDSVCLVLEENKSRQKSPLTSS